MRACPCSWALYLSPKAAESATLGRHQSAAAAPTMQDARRHPRGKGCPLGAQRATLSQRVNLGGRPSQANFEHSAVPGVHAIAHAPLPRKWCTGRARREVARLAQHLSAPAPPSRVSGAALGAAQLRLI